MGLTCLILGFNLNQIFKNGNKIICNYWYDDILLGDHILL